MESRADRVALQPTRQDGRARVEALLEAADAVIGECGYARATMSAIAARADTRIGSLYRFFPDKQAIATALVERYRTLLLDRLREMEAKVVGMTVPELADALLALLASTRPRAISSLLDAGVELGGIREEFRQQLIAAIASLLRRRAPLLENEAVRNAAAALLNTMKLAASLDSGDAPGGIGTYAELRLMTTLYLQHRLAPASQAEG